MGMSDRHNKTMGCRLVNLWLQVGLLALIGVNSEDPLYDFFFEDTALESFNDGAEMFLTGVLVRIDDDEFNMADPGGFVLLSCSQGYMRPAVVNKIQRENVGRSKHLTQVMIKNLTGFYKDCRVVEESPVFSQGKVHTPCFLTIDLHSLIVWTEVLREPVGNGKCRSSLHLDIGNETIGRGTVGLFFLPTSTLYSFPLELSFQWLNHVRLAMLRLSYVLLSGIQTCPNKTANY